MHVLVRAAGVSDVLILGTYHAGKFSCKLGGMSSEPRPNCEVTIWRWANSLLPGPPARIHAALLRGEIPPEVEPFDSRFLLSELERLGAEARLLWDEWSWKAVGRAESTAMVFLSCTQGPSLDALESVVRRLGLALFDDEECCMYRHGYPKLYVLLVGQGSPRNHYDITSEEIFAVVDALDASRSDPFATLINHSGDYVQCYREPEGFCVEWRENHGLGGDDFFDHWLAQERAESGVVLSDRGPEFLKPDSMRTIFRAFLGGQPRPEQFNWRRINDVI